MERRVEFQVEEQKLVGTLCSPQGKGAFPGVLLLHGLGSNRQGYITLAKKLAKEGIVAFCFDRRGCGESEGEFGRFTLADKLEDAKRALEILKGEVRVDRGRLGILGSSAGGYLASLLINEESVKSLVLRAPAIYKDEIFREVIGKVYKARLAAKEQYKESRPIKAITQFKGNLLVIQSESDEVIPEKVVKAYFDNAISAKKKSLYIFKGAAHKIISPKLRQELYNITCNWFKKTLNVKEN